MERYDYYAAVTEDVKNYIEENVNINDFDNKNEFCDYVNEQCWISDSVTGNGSGSYTFSTWKAEENLCHNFDLIKDTEDEFGELDMSNPEAIDVSIRCYLLGQVCNEVCNELWKEKETEEENKSDEL